jgi:hypothetical protein
VSMATLCASFRPLPDSPARSSGRSHELCAKLTPGDRLGRAAALGLSGRSAGALRRRRSLSPPSPPQTGANARRNRDVHSLLRPGEARIPARVYPADEPIRDVLLLTPSMEALPSAAFHRRTNRRSVPSLPLVAGRKGRLDSPSSSRQRCPATHPQQMVSMVYLPRPPGPRRADRVRRRPALRLGNGTEPRTGHGRGRLSRGGRRLAKRGSSAHRPRRGHHRHELRRLLGGSSTATRHEVSDLESPQVADQA